MKENIKRVAVRLMVMVAVVMMASMSVSAKMKVDRGDSKFEDELRHTSIGDYSCNAWLFKDVKKWVSKKYKAGEIEDIERELKDVNYDIDWHNQGYKNGMKEYKPCITMLKKYKKNLLSQYKKEEKKVKPVTLTSSNAEKYAKTYIESCKKHKTIAFQIKGNKKQADKVWKKLSKAVQLENGYAIRAFASSYKSIIKKGYYVYILDYKLYNRCFEVSKLAVDYTLDCYIEKYDALAECWYANITYPVSLSSEDARVLFKAKANELRAMKKDKSFFAKLSSHDIAFFCMSISTWSALSAYVRNIDGTYTCFNYVPIITHHKNLSSDDCKKIKDFNSRYEIASKYDYDIDICDMYEFCNVMEDFYKTNGRKLVVGCCENRAGLAEFWYDIHDIPYTFVYPPNHVYASPYVAKAGEKSVSVNELDSYDSVSSCLFPDIYNKFPGMRSKLNRVYTEWLNEHCTDAYVLK